MLLLGEWSGLPPHATRHPVPGRDVLEALDGRSAALMANHGAVTHGPSVEAALEAALLEWACTVYWRAAQVGEPRALDSDQRAAVVTAALERGYGTTRPAEGTAADG